MLAVLGGCGSDDTSIGNAAGGSGLDGPVMRHLAPYSGDAEDAEVSGVIEIEGDCLYIAPADGGERFPVVWPAATAWDADSGRVRLPNGEWVGPGDSVHGGGGYRYVGNVEAVAGEAAAVLAGACVDNQSSEIAVVNNQPDGIAAGDRVVDAAEPGDVSAGPAGPDGDWRVENLTVDGVRVELDPSWPITVTVKGDSISGTAACNQFFGVIDASSEAGTGRFVVSELGSTKMACEAHVMEIEQSFLAALEAVDSYEAADGLYVAEDGTATNFHLVPVS